MQFILDLPAQQSGALTYETEPGQRAAVSLEAGVAVLYVNRPACLFLSKLFALLSDANAPAGSHIHLGEHLDPESPEQIRIVLDQG